MTAPGYPPAYLAWAHEMNEENFFEAHELLEDLWRASDPPLKGFYQGLIQVAVSLHHLGHGNPVGAVKLWKTARKHLAPYPDVYEGLDLTSLLATMEANLAPYMEIPYPELRGRTVDWARVTRPRFHLDTPGGDS